MSGHSKWSTIKRKKGAADAKRGSAFTKLAKAIALAAQTGADPASNFKLALAIEKARAANMPASNIERAIARGSGQLKGEKIEEVLYEGYGPGGVAFIVQAATDNKNRTYSDVRSLFSKHGGRIAEPGSVLFQFNQKGIISLKTSSPEKVMLEAIDAGAEDVEADNSSLLITTAPASLNQVHQKLKAANLSITSAELEYLPKQTLIISDQAQAGRVLKLASALESIDDVTATFSNFEIPAEILAKIA